MMIKMTNGNLMDIFKTMNKFAECTGKLAYALSKTRRQMAKYVAAFETKRDELIMKYGTADDAGNIKVEAGTQEYQDFLNEIIPVTQEIVEVDVFQITKEEFDEANYYCKEANVRDYEMLEALFVKNEEVEEPEEPEYIDDNGDE